MVQRIAEAGHEVACHGWSHSLIYQQSPEHLPQDILRARALLRELSGPTGIGLSRSLVVDHPKQPWALDILAESGFKYDSSIFPAANYLLWYIRGFVSSL